MVHHISCGTPSRRSAMFRRKRMLYSYVPCVCYLNPCRTYPGPRPYLNGKPCRSWTLVIFLLSLCCTFFDLLNARACSPFLLSCFCVLVFFPAAGGRCQARSAQASGGRRLPAGGGGHRLPKEPNHVSFFFWWSSLDLALL